MIDDEKLRIVRFRSSFEKKTLFILRTVHMITAVSIGPYPVPDSMRHRKGDIRLGSLFRLRRPLVQRTEFLGFSWSNQERFGLNFFEFAQTEIILHTLDEGHFDVFLDCAQ